MEDSVFTKIIKGDIPAHKIYEDSQVIAFLTINPFADGHTLVVPKHQVDQLWDLDDEAYDYLWNVVKQIGTHLRTVTGKQRVGVVVKGFEVPHVHVHLVPIDRGTSLDPSDIDQTPPADDDYLRQMADKLHIA